MKKAFLILLSVFFFQSALPLQASIFSSVEMESTEVQEAQKKKGGFILKRALDDIKVDGKEKSLKGKTKIAVPFFRLNFMTDDKYRNAASGNTSKVKSELVGIETSTMQQVTDEMYADFLEQLRQAGYEVVPADEFKKSEKYEKLDNEYPDVKRDKVQMVPAGLTFPGKFRDPAPDISEDLGALVMKVDLEIDYLIINANQSRFNILKDAAHVEVTQGINALGIATVYSEGKMTTVTLQQPVTSGRPFGQISDDTSTLSKVNDVATFASGWVTQGGLGSKRQTSRSFDVIADNNQYRLAVGDVLAQINRRITALMQELRDKE